MTLQWKMWNRHKFTSEYENYTIIVEPPYWSIKQEEDIIDCCFWQPNIATGELQAKVQAERALEKIINYPGETNNH